MRGQAGFFDVDERLKQLSAKGDSLERLSAVVDLELFRSDLERAVPRSERAKGGRPPLDQALMFTTLVPAMRAGGRSNTPAAPRSEAGASPRRCPCRDAPPSGSGAAERARSDHSPDRPSAGDFGTRTLKGGAPP